MNNINNNSKLRNKIGNLISIKSTDSSISAKKGAKCCDISKYVSENDVEDFFSQENDSEFLPMSLDIDIDELKEKLNSSNNYDEFNIHIEQNGIYLAKSLIDVLKSDFEEFKEKAIDKAIDYVEKISDKFRYLNRTSREIFNDRGSWNLFITRYFLSGKSLLNRKRINAPLLFYPVELEIHKGKVKTIVKRDDTPVLNEKLIAFLLKEQGKEYKYLSQFKSVKNVNELIEKITSVIDIKIIKGTKNDLSFYNFDVLSFSSDDNNLFLNDGLSLGIYEPTGGKLKEDLEHLVNNNLYDSIFDSNTVATYEDIENEDNFDRPIFQISKLDIYQKYAVRSSLKQNTIIHGPPGTGKSEVITNIIANVISSGKKIMMVSEKKPALDVLEKRLGCLNIFILKMYEHKNKNDFYESICNLFQFIGNSWMSKTSKHNSINNLEREATYLNNLDRHHKFINRVNEVCEMESCEIEGRSFLTFCKEIKNLWGSIEEFFSFSNSGFIEEIDSFMDKYQLNGNNFFKLIFQFCEFLKNNNLNSQEAFNNFIADVSSLKEIKMKFNITYFDHQKIAEIQKNQEFLNEFFKSNFLYEKKLRENPFWFCSMVSSYQNFKNHSRGLINPQILKDFNKLHENISTFLNVFDKLKDSEKKYFLDVFLTQYKIEEKKPFSKIFYKKHLSDKDLLSIDLMKKMVSYDFESIDDFEYIYRNSHFFEPISIIYHFNNNIFNKKYLEFIEKSFDSVPFIFWEMLEKFSIDFDKFSQTKQLLSIYQEFIERFPHLKDKKFLNEYIKSIDNIKWDKFAIFIKYHIKNMLISELSSLNDSEKKYIEKAISVAFFKKRPGIFKYIDKFKDALLKLFPIVISLPNTIAMYIPLEKNYYDYGVYDEASQMFLEKGYPLLYRCGINIIAGDDKQLKPSNFFQSTNDVNDDEYEDNVDDLDVQESLLDRAKSSTWNVTMLKNHYRSEKKELISFSNEHIYNNELNFASLNKDNHISGIEIIDVDGFFDNQINKKEAGMVISLLSKYVNEYDSILVITSNIKQRQYLDALICSHNFCDNDVFEKYNLDNKISIINIENVQGNEADLVIFSLCYGKKDKDSLVYARFGPFISDGGKNRLNVAVTRAKKKMIVVKSLYADDINVSNESNHDLTCFKKFISFLDSEKQKLFDDNTQVNDSDEKKLFDSIFEEEVFYSLKPLINKNKYCLKTQYEVGSKLIDIVIFDKIKNNIALGIEVDCWRSYSNFQKRILEIYNQKFLESRGYNIFRVLELDWENSKDIVLDNILFQLKEYEIKEFNSIKNNNTYLEEKIFDQVEEVNQENKKFIELDNFDVDDKSKKKLFQSTFEEEVFYLLEPLIDKNKYCLKTQYEIGGKFVDIVVIDKVKNTLALGIEVDGWRYHSDYKQRILDLNRQKFLESKGCNIFRVLEIKWNDSKKSVLNEILLYLKEYEKNILNYTKNHFSTLEPKKDEKNPNYSDEIYNLENFEVENYEE